MYGTKESKQFPTLSPVEPSSIDGRTAMFVNEDGGGITSAKDVSGVSAHLILFASDADEDIEYYATTSAAN